MSHSPAYRNLKGTFSSSSNRNLFRCYHLSAKISSCLTKFVHNKISLVLFTIVLPFAFKPPIYGNILLKIVTILL